MSTTPTRRNRALEAMRWSPVTERLPEVGEFVLVAFDGGGIDVDRIRPDEGRWDAEVCFGDKVTHWMPKPKHPSWKRTKE